MSSAVRKKTNHLSSSVVEERAIPAPQGRLLILCGTRHEQESDKGLQSSLRIESVDLPRATNLRLVLKVLCCLVLGLLVGSHLPSDYVGEDMIELPEEGLDIQTLARQLRLPEDPARGSPLQRVSSSDGVLSLGRRAHHTSKTFSGLATHRQGDSPLKAHNKANKELSTRSRSAVGLIEQIIKKHGKRTAPSKQLAHNIVEVSASLGYDPIFVAAVIKSESAFNTYARSHKGARGLMQLMPATGAWLVETTGISKGELSDPRHNLRLGITYLKQLEAQYSGNRLFALVAYNWGPGHVRSATGGKRRVPRECMKYALTILRDYSNWSKGVI